MSDELVPRVHLYWNFICKLKIDHSDYSYVLVIGITLSSMLFGGLFLSLQRIGTKIKSQECIPCGALGRSEVIDFYDHSQDSSYSRPEE